MKDVDGQRRELSILRVPDGLLQDLSIVYERLFGKVKKIFATFAWVKTAEEDSFNHSCLLPFIGDTRSVFHFYTVFERLTQVILG